MHNDSENIIRRQYYPTRVFHRIVQLYIYYYIYNLYILRPHLYRTSLKCMGNYILWVLLRKNHFHVVVVGGLREKKQAMAKSSQRFTNFNNRRLE